MVRGLLSDSLWLLYPPNHHQSIRDCRELENYEEGEIREMVELYMSKGFSLEDAESGYTKRFLFFMFKHHCSISDRCFFWILSSGEDHGSSSGILRQSHDGRRARPHATQPCCLSTAWR